MPNLPSMSIMGLGGSASGNRTDSTKVRGKDEGTPEDQWTRACRAVLWVLKRVLLVESEADRQGVMESVPR